MFNLILVDYQNDFITGTMSVKSARNNVEETKKFIKKYKNEIDTIIFAIEWHPFNHCSFKKYGGEFQHHCIQYTPGACIEPKLLKYVQSLGIKYQVTYRGEYDSDDKIGAFYDIEHVSDNLGSRYYFDSLAEANSELDFVITGVSSSTIETIKNMLLNNENNIIVPKVFMGGIISSDGCKTFSNFVKEYRLDKIA